MLKNKLKKKIKKKNGIQKCNILNLKNKKRKMCNKKLNKNMIYAIIKVYDGK